MKSTIVCGIFRHLLLTQRCYFMPSTASKTLETFDNPAPERDYFIHFDIPEFTCICPKTGQPDFAHIYIDYVANEKCVELKSLKLYMWHFREVGAFHEAITNQILEDIVKAIHPRFLRVTAKFNVRGGIYTNVTAEHRQDNWQAPKRVDID